MTTKSISANKEARAFDYLNKKGKADAQYLSVKSLCLLWCMLGEEPSLCFKH